MDGHDHPMTIPKSRRAKQTRISSIHPFLPAQEERREAWPDESPRPPITALEPRSAVLEPGAERRGTPRNAAESEGEQTVDLEECRNEQALF